MNSQTGRGPEASVPAATHPRTSFSHSTNSVWLPPGSGSALGWSLQSHRGCLDQGMAKVRGGAWRRACRFWVTS